MIDWIKNNWKIIAGVVVVTLAIWWSCCGTAVVEEAPKELTDEQVEELF